MSLTKQLIGLVPLTLILLGLLSYNFMSAQWSAPTATAPGDNATAPINISSNYQAKLGDLGAIRMRAGEYCDAAGLVCSTITAMMAGGGLGVGQRWRSVTGSRARDIWYQNTTGRPISVYVWVDPGDGQLYANTVGLDAGQVMIAGPDNSSGTRDNLFGIIPAGHWYKQTGRNATTWSELR